MTRWVFALVAVVGPSIALGSVLVIVPLRVEALGLSSWILAAGLLGMSVVEMVTGPLAGRWSDRVGRKTPFLIGLAIMAPCVVAFAVIPAFAGIAAVLAVYAVGSAFAFTTSMTSLADLATRAGLNQGYHQPRRPSAGRGLIVGALVGGAIVGRVGYLAGGLAVAGLLGPWGGDLSGGCRRQERGGGGAGGVIVLGRIGFGRASTPPDSSSSRIPPSREVSRTPRVARTRRRTAPNPQPTLAGSRRWEFAAAAATGSGFGRFARSRLAPFTERIPALARMIPPVVDGDAPPGERRLYELLATASDTDDWIAIHGLHLPTIPTSSVARPTSS